MVYMGTMGLYKTDTMVVCYAKTSTAEPQRNSLFNLSKRMVNIYTIYFNSH